MEVMGIDQFAKTIMTWILRMQSDDEYSDAFVPIFTSAAR